jgi:hypothetical protein
MSTTKKVYRKTSDSTTLKGVFAKAGLIPNQDELVEEKAIDIRPKYKGDKAPKVERFVICTNEVEKEIMEEVPASTPKTKAFRKLLKIAALLQIKLEGIYKRVEALKVRVIGDVVNAAEVIRTFKLQLETEDKLASVLDAMGC